MISRKDWIISIIIILTIAGGLIYYSFGKHKHALSNKYLGPKRCAECHQKQFESWEKTRMARSFEVLKRGVKAREKKVVGLDPDKDYTQEQFCLPCHTTGFGLIGGFVSIEKTPDMAGVTCEACHGPGGAYVGSTMSMENPTFKTTEARKAGLIYPPTARVCRKCHNEDSPFIDMKYIFKLKERIKKGTHEHFELQYEHGPK